MGGKVGLGEKVDKSVFLHVFVIFTSFDAYLFFLIIDFVAYLILGYTYFFVSLHKLIS